MKVLLFVFSIVYFIQLNAQEIKFGYFINQEETKDIEILTLNEAAELHSELNIDPNSLANSFYFSLIEADGSEKAGFGYYNNLTKIYDIKFNGKSVGVQVYFRTDEYIEIYYPEKEKVEVFVNVPDEIALNKELIPYVSKKSSEVFFRFVKGDLKGKLIFIEEDKYVLLDDDYDFTNKFISEEEYNRILESEDTNVYAEELFCLRIQDSMNTRFKRYYFESSYEIDAENIYSIDNENDTSYTVRFDYFKNKIYLINTKTKNISIGELGEDFYYKESAKLAKMDSITRRLYLARFVFQYNDSIKLYLMEKNEFETDEMDAYLVKNENKANQETFFFTVKKIESSTAKLYYYRYTVMNGKKEEYIELRVREPSCIFDFSPNCSILGTKKILKNTKTPFVRIQ